MTVDDGFICFMATYREYLQPSRQPDLKFKSENNIKEMTHGEMFMDPIKRENKKREHDGVFAVSESDPWERFF